MLFHVRPPETPREYVLLSPVYGLNEPDEEVPPMTRREALRAGRIFLNMVDDPDATVQAVNTVNRQVYIMKRVRENVYLVTWANPPC